LPPTSTLKPTPNENEGRRIATRLVAGNAMTRRARRSATRFALARNARCNANKPNVPNAPYTASNRNAQSAVPKTCVRRIAARNVRPFALRPNATPLVSPRKRTVRRYVKKRRAAGRVLNPPLVLVPSASSNAPNPLVMLKTSRNAVNVPRRTCASLRNTPVTSVVKPRWNRRSWS